MKTKFKEVYEAAFQEVVARYAGLMAEVRGVSVNQVKKHALFDVMDFEDIHGKQAVVDLYGFLVYAEESDVLEHVVNGTLAHDIGGRNDQFLTPRSADYATTVWGEGYLKF